LNDEFPIHWRKRNAAKSRIAREIDPLAKERLTKNIAWCGMIWLYQACSDERVGQKTFNREPRQALPCVVPGI
jgi:hypothetical protein